MDDRRKKQRLPQNGGFELQDMGGGILRFPFSPPRVRIRPRGKAVTRRVLQVKV